MRDILDDLLDDDVIDVENENEEEIPISTNKQAAKSLFNVGIISFVISLLFLVFGRGIGLQQGLVFAIFIMTFCFSIFHILGGFFYKIKSTYRDE